MKMKKLKVATLLLAGAMLTTSCIGSFGLFNKLLSWNKTATDSKFLNEIIFLILSLPYAICGTADVVVLNTIEFWTGDNPMANNGKTKQVMGQDGKYYAVKTLKDGYEITAPTGEVTKFLYDKSTDSWSQVANGKQTELFRFNEDGTIKATLPNGKKMDVALNEAGVYQVHMTVNGGTYWAMK